MQLAVNHKFTIIKHFSGTNWSHQSKKCLFSYKYYTDLKSLNPLITLSLNPTLSTLRWQWQWSWAYYMFYFAQTNLPVLSKYLRGWWFSCTPLKVHYWRTIFMGKGTKNFRGNICIFTPKNPVFSKFCNWSVVHV